MLLVAPVEDYCGEGAYLLNSGDGEYPTMAERHVGRPVIMVWKPNPL
jgi:hypothetical protein